MASGLIGKKIFFPSLNLIHYGIFILYGLLASAVNRAAATAMAKRHADGSLPVEDFNIEVEDQSGKKVNLGSETDHRYITQHFQEIHLDVAISF